MSSEDMQDRARGVMVGMAVGDALGAPVEFDPPEQIAQLRNWVFRMPGGGFDWLPGEFTDDTQMALLLSRHLLDPGLELLPLGRSFAEWAAHPETKDVGTQTSAALEVIRSGGSVDDVFARLGEGSAGNGSLMRVAPVALRHAGNPELAVDVARQQSTVTHPAPDCIESCAVFIELLVQALSTGEKPDIDSLAGSAQTEAVNSAIGDTASEVAPKMSGWVVDTLRGALWAVRHAESFEDAVWRAVSLGRDADTVGAVAGALAGAVWGLHGIPQELSGKLTSEHPLFRDDYPEALVRTADRLLERSQQDAGTDV